jgi:hypothetical protein
MHWYTSELRPFHSTKTAGQCRCWRVQIGVVSKGRFKILPETTNLAEAKSLMDQIRIWSDVFATEDGTPNTKVVGWVTNVIVEEQSKL